MSCRKASARETRYGRIVEPIILMTVLTVCAVLVLWG